MSLRAVRAGLRRGWGALGSWFVDGSCGAKCAQVIGREVAEVDVIGTDALEVCLRPLGGPNGRELGDEVILARLVQGLELRRAGVGEVVEVERVGNDTLQTAI